MSPVFSSTIHSHKQSQYKICLEKFLKANDTAFFLYYAEMKKWVGIVPYEKVWEMVCFVKKKKS